MTKMTEELGLVGKIIIGIVSAPAICNLAVMAFNITNIPPFQKKITSKAELGRIVKEEAEKLGLDISKIDIKHKKYGFSAIKEGERYTVNLRGLDYLATRKLIKHELCHVLEDCDKEDTDKMYYTFIAEPRASLYATFGIKI